MLNPLELYAECGERAARALNENDIARYNVERDYFRRMCNFERKANDKLAAYSTYEQAYKRARSVSR